MSRALALVETPPASPEAVARLMAAARIGGLALSHGLADRLESLAVEAREIAGLGDAVPVGVRELASRIVDASEFQAATIRKLSR